MKVWLMLFMRSRLTFPDFGLFFIAASSDLNRSDMPLYSCSWCSDVWHGVSSPYAAPNVITFSCAISLKAFICVVKIVDSLHLECKIGSFKEFY